MSYDMTEANRRIANLIQIGVIDSVDYAAGRARVRIGELVTAPLPMVAARAGADRAWWPYEPGEQVCVFAQSGNLSGGVILGAIYGGAYAAAGDQPGLHRHAYADGTVIEYDRNTSHLAVKMGGGTVEIIASGGIGITGTVTVSGDVIADGISLKSHVHGGVVPGAADTQGPK